MSYMHSIHFTLDEANNLVEEIKPLIEEMTDLKLKLDEKGYDIFRHTYFGGIGPNGTGAFPAEMERLVEIVKLISSKGIIIKGIDNGLIDFPHIRSNGDEVYLCWKSGEGDIAYWHKIPEGFSGRRHINEL
jgi:hypothetical protein